MMRDWKLRPLKERELGVIHLVIGGGVLRR